MVHTIAIRADASFRIGTGHIMRCITLADALREAGANVQFLCRARPGNLIGEILLKGFSVYELPFDSSVEDGFDCGGSLDEEIAFLCAALDSRVDGKKILIVDHYGLDREYELRCREVVDEVLALEDGPSREHASHHLLDQNFGANHLEYAGLCDPNTNFMLGPEFSLIRDEFRVVRKRQQTEPNDFVKPDNSCPLIFFGGTDPDGFTLEAVHRLLNYPDYSPIVVVGKNNPRIPELEQILSQRPGSELHIQTNRMAELMNRASWYLGAGGSVTWERFCLGLPGIVVPIAENQVRFSKALAEAGLQCYRENLDFLSIPELLQDCLDSLKFVRKPMMELVDGLGKKRVLAGLGL